MSNINKEDLISYLNNEEKITRKLQRHFDKTEFKTILNVLCDVKNFVNNMKTENETKEVKSFSCRNCKYCVKCMYDDINYRCNKYNLLMLGGIPSSDICQNND